MKIEFSKKLKFYHKINCLIHRNKTRKLLQHIEFIAPSEIIENKKSLLLISQDGFETQVSKKSLWYADKKSEKEAQVLLEIGKATYLQDCRIGPFLGKRKVSIGSFCSFGARIDFRINGVRGKNQFTSYPIPFIDKNIIHKNNQNNDEDLFIKIGNDVFIGEDVKIMQNVTIGDGVIVGTSSIVTANKVLEPYGIYVGIPAKLVKYRFDKDIIEQLLQLKWWNYSKNEIIDMGLQHIDFLREKDKALLLLKKLNAKYT